MSYCYIRKKCLQRYVFSSELSVNFVIFTDMHGELVKIIGVMSGTSLDGLDIVYVEIDKSTFKNFKILSSDTIKYSVEWESKLREGIHKNPEELLVLDADYGVLLSKLVLSFIEKYQITELDFIASHGHTILHKPDEGYTLQIGNGKIISKKTNQKVICDFRTQDVSLGGQGAPLVPVGDELLFSEYDACLNLGGFANISYKINNERIAFDICPVNIVLNHYVKQIGFDYDNEGEIAAKGEVNQGLLNQLNQLPFYEKEAPKSLGLEWVQEQVFPMIDSYELSVSIILRTFAEHIAIKISSSLKYRKEVLVTGGGVFNSFLMERLRFLSPVKITIPSYDIINYKEALIFAFLGLLRSENQVNCLSSVTGADKDHSSGRIFIP
jgi:anhydro-N-acetylmuramic acid kinase